MQKETRAKRIKILFIAMTDSIHTARWISQICDQEWDLYIFSSAGNVYNANIPKNVNALTLDHKIINMIEKTRNRRLVNFFGYVFDIKTSVISCFYPQYKGKQLARYIKKIKPDIIHTLEFQSAGYLTVEAKKNISVDFPIWIASIWGSDIYLFGRLAAHIDKVKTVLSGCDYLLPDCRRDINLANKLGFSHKYLPVFPVAGGYDIAELIPNRQIPPSKRNIILIKGYQGWSGRALFALAAIKKCKDLLKDYSIQITSANRDVEIAAELLSQETGLQIHTIKGISHTEMLKITGNARLSIGIGISDGSPHAMLEALIMGAFPIQSFTACADEWIMNGVSGFLVPPDDPAEIAKAIRNALEDDALVDSAADINFNVAQKKLNRDLLKGEVIKMYYSIVRQKNKQKSQQS
jgi:hypothetical protein